MNIYIKIIPIYMYCYIYNNLFKLDTSSYPADHITIILYDSIFHLNKC